MVKYHDLDKKTIDSLFDDKSYGNYVVGHKENDEFIPTYVGRGELKIRLTRHFTDEYNDDLFYFEDKKDDDAACKEECEDYHHFKPISEGGTLRNKEHPKLFTGQKCPRCGRIGGKN